MFALLIDLEFLVDIFPSDRHHFFFSTPIFTLKPLENVQFEDALEGDLSS